MNELMSTSGRSASRRHAIVVVTSEHIAGHRIVKVLGLVRGNTVRTRHAGHDIMAALKTLVGGEVENYTKMIAEAREQSLDRMMDHAASKGANAIVCARFTTSTLMAGAAELLAYGTAVVIEPE